MTECMFCQADMPHGWCDDGTTFNGEVAPPPVQVNSSLSEEALKFDCPPGCDCQPDESKPTPLEIIEQAKTLVYGDRQQDYGHPADDYGRTAALWSALLGVNVTAKQAALCMVLVKLSREMNAPKPDNLVDAHGYLMVAGRIDERAMGRE